MLDIYINNVADVLYDLRQHSVLGHQIVCDQFKVLYTRSKPGLASFYTLLVFYAVWSVLACGIMFLVALSSRVIIIMMSFCFAFMGLMVVLVRVIARGHLLTQTTIGPLLTIDKQLGMCSLPRQQLDLKLHQVRELQVIPTWMSLPDETHFATLVLLVYEVSGDRTQAVVHIGYATLRRLIRDCRALAGHLGCGVRVQKRRTRAELVGNCMRLHHYDPTDPGWE